VLAAVAEIVSYGLPEDFWNTYPERLNDLTLEQVTHAGQATLNPDNLTWVVIGDRERIEAGLTELNIGQIRLIDVEGQFVDANISSKTATD
jgi:zinc protease